MTTNQQRRVLAPCTTTVPSPTNKAGYTGNFWQNILLQNTYRFEESVGNKTLQICIFEMCWGYILKIVDIFEILGKYSEVQTF